jgi:hypothetical protein
VTTLHVYVVGSRRTAASSTTYRRVGPAYQYIRKCAGRDWLWAKTKAALAYTHYYREYDWFVKVDDDTYMLVDNLRLVYVHTAATTTPAASCHPFHAVVTYMQGLMLSPHNPEELVWFRCHFNLVVRQGFVLLVRVIASHNLRVRRAVPCYTVSAKLESAGYFYFYLANL